MSIQRLIDCRSGVIGYIDTARDGTLVGRDAQFHTVGYYDPRTDTTSDNRKQPIGNGNLLPSMIACA